MIKNPPRIDYSNKFDKQLKKAPLEIKIAFKQRLSLFLEDPAHPQLKNHKLTGQLSDYKSINITGDWRAIYSESEDESGEKIIIFEVLGTHSELYG
ncbi:hypothetical protein A3B42_03610 [Candidatus Daviesbacteria bacterium RIFCSPLOWO2_01_FULL_38_10]|nr:MAG: hypothetical protein A3D02_01570 [Candidatus Daviesbacteria bacterium RIFCSPHIGHO2_02_FULL_39_41]OGE39501.1 MAG: hypothetical protein A3B42_03610 [Candidatus Daviesbacteria bacterium RIFCSPLOWO2_01_FULL_38_10]OGE45082.1 MAG: hypothetical protein A3E67_03975 [Candidatus Daviesbacteria bacterium RIFCSPHIGHO2_12_FULL_38_25]OGE68583.1 MAG: hypothetical protein A3H81_01975 [Candidatus Daviesbacteria bacterium RIFCSPLOWO2_02_FULL_38_18]OGE73147.1 MAG: hypothetical protein A3H18_03695 [Candida